MDINDFVKKETLKAEKGIFISKMIITTIGYILLTLWLNSIRSTASLWFIWPMIIIQFTLYFLLFSISWNRSRVLGLSNVFGNIIFIGLAIIGRINDWEIVIIPMLLITMITLSSTTKKISKEYHIVPE